MANKVHGQGSAGDSLDGERKTVRVVIKVPVGGRERQGGHPLFFSILVKDEGSSAREWVGARHSRDLCGKRKSIKLEWSPTFSVPGTGAPVRN